MAERREGVLFPFWSILALDLLARASLAKLHSVLLADPREGNNILYAFGYGDPKTAKTIPAKTVFERLQKIIPEFTDQEFKICMWLMDLRNQELHTSAPALEDCPTRLWLADFFRICRILLSQQGKDLADLFGQEEAPVAEEMIRASSEEVKGEVLKQIQEKKIQFEKLAPVEQTRKKKEGSEAILQPPWSNYARMIKCPVCEADAVLSGEKIRSMNPQLSDNEITEEVVVLPTRFQCKSCGLVIQGHGRLNHANLGGHYSVDLSYDPADYYGWQKPTEEEEWGVVWGDEYGND